MGLDNWGTYVYIGIVAVFIPSIVAMGLNFLIKVLNQAASGRD